MTPNVDKEHQIETFKSLIQISVEGLKLLALLNGGAVVALLAYLGNLAGKPVSAPDIRIAMGCFLAGLVLCGLAFAASYLTQLGLYNESLGAIPYGRHGRWLWLAMALGLLSLSAFAARSYLAASQLK